MSANSGFELHAANPERQYEEWVVDAAEAMDGFAPPFGDNNHYFVAVTDAEDKNKVVAAAQLDAHSAWLGKMTFAVSPELNGHTEEVVEKMTSQMQTWAKHLGMMSLEVAERVKKDPVRRPYERLEPVNRFDNPSYGRKPIRRIGL